MRRKQGENGRRRIDERFSMGQMLTAYGKVYDQIIERRGGAN